MPTPKSVHINKIAQLYLVFTLANEQNSINLGHVVHHSKALETGFNRSCLDFSNLNHILVYKSLN